MKIIVSRILHIFKFQSNICKIHWEFLSNSPAVECYLSAHDSRENVHILVCKQITPKEDNINLVLFLHKEVRFLE